jgi:hypothetical protein
MQLNIPVVYQKQGSVDCGPSVLSMWLAYYGKNMPVAKITKQVEVYKGLGTYTPQLGTFMIEQGFNVEIVTLHPDLFTLSDQQLSQKQILERFRSLVKKAKKVSSKRALRFFIQFMEGGGKIKVAIPFAEDVREEIKEKRPLGALLTSNYLLGNEPRFNFHFNLITGIDAEFVYLNDPLIDKRGGKQRFKIDEYFYGIYASAYAELDNACLMKARKK